MKKINNTFYCFSPPVMIATFFIEIALVMFTLLFRKLNLAVRLGVLLITCLAIFQLAEYGICQSLGLSGSNWARLGFVTVTLLPPLGLHLMATIAQKKLKPLLIMAYLAAAVWIAVFLFGNIMTGAVCEANYVIFHISEPHEGLYYLYYDALLLIAMGVGLVFAQKKRKRPTKVRKALKALVIGYTAFIIPSIFFTLIEDYRGTDSPLPSVMCGFAVILALILSLRTIPLVSERK